MSRDPRIDPQAGDKLFNQSRTVIRRMGDKVLFGIDTGTAENCGAFTCSLEDWREWAAGSFDQQLSD